ncbi:MAG: hypothetical protein F6K42_33780, partial [Leptolyngbya sp. SIO1D8]|nr:hypothetical protein [Leptolyngbya sp. SIO1D8]
EITLALPEGAIDATVEITACDRQSDRHLQLEPRPATGLRLDRHSFKEYGTHSVEIECVFPENFDFFAIDVLPEGVVETAATLTTLSFTRDRPVRQWTWFADSPFQPGYRYRQHAHPGESPRAWSSLQSAFERLMIPVSVVQEVKR